MKGLGSKFLTFVVAAALSGCSSPQLARTSWSSERATALPTTQTAARSGSLLVATEPTTPAHETETTRRNFAVFTAEGRLVFTEFAGGREGGERVRLPAGRYVVVSLVGQGLTDRHLEELQAVVATGAETRVDFTLPPTAPATRVSP